MKDVMVTKIGDVLVFLGLNLSKNHQLNSY